MRFLVVLVLIASILQDYALAGDKEHDEKVIVKSDRTVVIERDDARPVYGSVGGAYKRPVHGPSCTCTACVKRRRYVIKTKRTAPYYKKKSSYVRPIVADYDKVRALPVRRPIYKDALPYGGYVGAAPYWRGAYLGGYHGGYLGGYYGGYPIGGYLGGPLGGYLGGYVGGIAPIGFGGWYGGWSPVPHRPIYGTGYGRYWGGWLPNKGRPKTVVEKVEKIVVPVKRNKRVVKQIIEHHKHEK